MRKLNRINSRVESVFDRIVQAGISIRLPFNATGFCCEKDPTARGACRLKYADGGQYVHTRRGRRRVRENHE
jgi:hypothetical protein